MDRAERNRMGGNLVSRKIYSATLNEPLQRSMISSYDRQKLKEEFDKLPKPKCWIPWNPSVEAVVGDLSASELEDPQGNAAKLGLMLLRSWYCGWTEEYRFEYACYMWLRPCNDPMKLEELRGLQTKSGLNHLKFKSFLARLKNTCIEFSRHEGEFQLWVRRRVALLEYFIDGVPDAPELRSASESCLYRLLVCNSLSHLNPEESYKYAQVAIDEGLKNAALAALSAIVQPGKDFRFTANLMMPIRLNESTGLSNSENFKAAEQLWGENHKVALGVVAQTGSDEYLGFWVPFAKGNGNMRLPGAPTAYELNRGSAVFKDDLPDLSNFQDGLRTKWTAYMSNDYMHDMFISLPLISFGHGGLPPECTAVLNIDLCVEGDKDVWRAYHSKWLQHAIDRAALYIRQAQIALLHKQKAIMELGLDKEQVILDKSINPWHELPNLEIVEKLPSIESDSNE